MNVADGVLVDPLAAAHERAVEGVNAWRGRFLASFTRVEMAVSEALVTLAASRENIALPHMFGQRLEVLREVLDAGGTAAELSKAVASFALHLPLRVFLTHGDARVTMDRDGRWQAVLTVLALKRTGGDKSFLVLEESEAQVIARTLARERQRLVTRLAQWCGELTIPADHIALRIGATSV